MVIGIAVAQVLCTVIGMMTRNPQLPVSFIIPLNHRAAGCRRITVKMSSTQYFSDPNNITLIACPGFTMFFKY